MSHDVIHIRDVGNEPYVTLCGLSISGTTSVSLSHYETQPEHVLMLIGRTPMCQECEEIVVLAARHKVSS